MKYNLTNAEVTELLNEGEAGSKDEPFDGVSFSELADKYEKEDE